MGLIPRVGRQLHHRAAQPGQAQRRPRPQHRRGPRAAPEAGRDLATCSSPTSCPTRAAGCASTSTTSAPSTRTSSTCAARVTAPGARGRGAATTAARSGPAAARRTSSPPEGEYPVTRPAARSATPGRRTIAGGISAALFHRERTGEALVVDNSLLGIGTWATGFSGDVRGLRARQLPEGPRGATPEPARQHVQDVRRPLPVARHAAVRPLLGRARAPPLGGPSWPTIPGSPTAARGAERQECITLLDEIFAEHTFEEWRELLADRKACGRRCSAGVIDDPQVLANN